MGSRDDDDTRIAGVRRTPATAEIAAAQGTGEASEAAPIASAAAIESPRIVEAVVAALAAGTMNPALAQSQLVEAAVRAQLPEHASAATVASVCGEVEALLDADPTLAALLASR